MTDRPSVLSYLDAPRPLAFAHRGGAFTGDNAGVENSLAAFSFAYQSGYRFLETDVRCTSDGVPYACHDEHLERLTGKDLNISQVTSIELDSVLLGDREPIVRLDVLLMSLPDARFNIDVKAFDAIEPTCSTIEAVGAEDRVLLASFSHRTLRSLRKRMPQVPTSASAFEVARLVLRIGVPGAPRAFQVPPKRGPIPVVTRALLRRIHAAGKQLHVWTIDDVPTMHELLDLGVDGIMTDRIDVLKQVLLDRGEWNPFV